MRSLRIAPTLTLGVLALALPAAAQQTKTAPSRGDAKGGNFESRQALETYYEDQFLQLDRRRIDDLTTLATKLPADQAEQTYQEIFNLAVARDLYEAAEPAAEAYLARKEGDPRTLSLATFVNVIAAANKGDYEESLARLGRYLAVTGTPGQEPAAGTPQLDPTTTFAVGEAFIQKLIRDHKYDVAKQAANLFVDKSADKQVQRHFASRLDRINMLGKGAPPIAGTTVDGEDVSLADFKGKVVLVDFWASWAPPCVASLPLYNSLYEQYKDQGFTVLGVNLDANREGIRQADLGKLRAGMRDFLVRMRVGWPVVMNGTGDQDFAEAYGVTEIPTNFLIGPDGRITHVELTGPALEKAVAESLGVDKDKGGKGPARPAAAAPAADPAGAGEKVKLPKR